MFCSSAGAAKAAGKRPYEKWSDAEEDTFFLALKATAGCLPNVVCTAAAKRIGTKDYIQVIMCCRSSALVSGARRTRAMVSNCAEQAQQTTKLIRGPVQRVVCRCGHTTAG
jgi:hypothetical protein